VELGVVGLGRMGASMAERLLGGGHRVAGYDPRAEARREVVGKGGVRADSLAGLVEQLQAPCTIWLMVPAGHPVDQTVAALGSLLAPGDVIVDGGNSYYRDTMRRAEDLARRELHLVDVGTSGGIWGLEEGYSLMIGGDEAIVRRLAPIFQTLAPAPGQGWGHVGPSGAGHFVKMIHNGIEYGLMQAYAEGFELLRHKRELALDLRRVADIWRHGSVIRSWLLDLIARALAENPGLHGIAPFVPDSGEGRWTVHEAMELECAIPVITMALQRRFRSREEEPFGDKLLAVMRQQFGGHPVRSETPSRPPRP